ncbi:MULTISPECIES: hypothetical protein [unclassified Archaeoglobus]|uniref:hypothetical protein n=1 Tax=unclassified Archaeoglobus TaxID=2643606 RepID=UPI0025BCA5EB|nr:MULTISPECIES: hypothetical protein [unclassified Archaeoglobus]
MSFAKILEKKGIDVTLIKVFEQDIDGYLEESEQVETIRAVILPLKSEELRFWQEAGITKASMKAYVDVELEIGWQMEIDGKRYIIRAYENYQSYRKAILEEAV